MTKIEKFDKTETEDLCVSILLNFSTLVIDYVTLKQNLGFDLFDSFPKKTNFSLNSGMIKILYFFAAKI